MTILPTLPLICIAVLACGQNQARPRSEELRGPRIEPAMPKPAFVLQQPDGTPFDFAQETRGKLTFLFFGYTNCPDVCPLHMANLAWAIGELPEQERSSVRVVFVTTDPARDTPDRLRAWLDRFDSSFVALTGSAEALAQAQRMLGMPPARREGSLVSANYGVSHGAQLWAFTPDDSAHVVYPFGMKREDLAADLAKLARVWPASP